MSIITDIIETTTIMTGKRYNEYREYDKLYPFTTENLVDTYTELEGKEILTVAGSGDQALNAVAAGAESVDVFDINRLSLYYLRLKKCAIEHLSYEDFKDFFSYRSKELYERIRMFLGEDTRNYWDYFYSHFIVNPHQSLTSSFLFYQQTAWSDYKFRNNYFDRNEYERLQRLLPYQSFNFYHSDVTNLHNLLKKKYDRIYLSNINQYMNPKELQTVLRNLSDYLKEYGEIYFAYIYSNKEDTVSSTIEPDDTIKVPSVVNVDTKDTILIQKKASII